MIEFSMYFNLLSIGLGLLTPKSRKPKGEPISVELYPYGCAKLRMTEMPLIK